MSQWRGTFPRVHIKTIKATGYKRFTDLSIELPEPVRVVVMAGPNGTGKSSLFDALRSWADGLARNQALDESYHLKTDRGHRPWNHHLTIETHEPLPTDEHGKKALVYLRSAYRNEADFSVSRLQRKGDPLDGRRVSRTIENDQTVADNYERLVATTIDLVYGGNNDELEVGQLREQLIGEVRDSVQRLLPELMLTGPGEPLDGGTFHFEKNGVPFEYRNLSGGEKAALDLVLDVVVKREAYGAAIYCIDEPEIHLNTRVHGALFEELRRLVPQQSQIWLASHSVGILRAARDLARQDPRAVAFLDFELADFETAVTLAPVKVSRSFWRRTLSTAIGDLADLVAPERVVLVEGSRTTEGARTRAEFDARCLRNIFGDDDLPTDFLPAGNSTDVLTDRHHIGASLQEIVKGIEVIRVIDRDLRSQQEVEDARADGVRILSRRHLESYLLDSEVLSKLCRIHGKDNVIDDLLRAKAEAIENSVARGNDADDIKSIAGDMSVAARRLLSLEQPGSTTEAFLADTLAPLLTPDMTTYRELREDIFGTHPDASFDTGLT